MLSSTQNHQRIRAFCYRALWVSWLVMAILLVDHSRAQATGESEEPYAERQLQVAELKLHARAVNFRNRIIRQRREDRIREQAVSEFIAQRDLKIESYRKLQVQYTQSQVGKDDESRDAELERRHEQARDLERQRQEINRQRYVTLKKRLDEVENGRGAIDERMEYGL